MESRWFAKIWVIPVVGKNHPWILKINGHKYDERRNSLFWTVSNYLSTGYLLTIVRNTAFMDTTSTRLQTQHPHHESIVTWAFSVLHQEGKHPFCGVSAQHAYSERSHWRETSHASPSGGTFYKTTWQYSSKVSRSWKIRSLRKCLRQETRRDDNFLHCGIQSWILSRKGTSVDD